jgi:hypothetical protein
MAGPALAVRASILLLAALSLALSFAHVMEMAPRLRWEPGLWMAVTNFGGLYYLFGRVGAGIDLGATASVATLAFRLRGRPGSRLVALAAGLLVAGLGTWFTAVEPANAIMAGWTPGTVPADFAAVRDRWEYGHAAVALIKSLGFVALALGLLTEAGASAARAGAP